MVTFGVNDGEFRTQLYRLIRKSWHGWKRILCESINNGADSERHSRERNSLSYVKISVSVLNELPKTPK
jgi:hypothetical protein